MERGSLSVVSRTRNPRAARARGHGRRRPAAATHTIPLNNNPRPAPQYILTDSPPTARS